METVYLICAIAGGTLIVCQFLLTLLGMGHHDLGGHDAGGHDVGGHDASHGGHDASHGSEPNWFFSMLTLRTLSAAFAFFGLAGMAASKSFAEPWPPLGIALLAGAAALVGVAKLMQLLVKLNVDGTIRIERAVGARGTVYLGIPAKRSGIGKVHVNIHNRTVEYNAVTPQETLPTGAAIVVVNVVNADTLEVTSSSTPEGASHG
jgi:hypothetical protein